MKNKSFSKIKYLKFYVDTDECCLINKLSAFEMFKTFSILNYCAILFTLINISVETKEGATTLSITTFSTTSLSIKTLRLIISNTRHSR
jgi:hypothetical protein